MLLDRFRRPRWRHPDPEIRRQAVQRLSANDAGEQATLRSLALDDPAPGVRAVAVKRLGELALLRDRLESDPDANVRESARARYRQCLANGSGGGGLQARLDELEHCADAQVLAHLARSGREEALRAAALERMRDAAVLAECAMNDPVARLRQRAVERIADSRTLAGLAETAKRRDSRVARLARERYEQLAAGQARGERDRKAALDLLTRLDELTGAGSHARAELLRLGNRRRSLSALTPELVAELDARLAERHERRAAAAGQASDNLGRLDTLLHRLEQRELLPDSALPELERVLRDAPASTDARHVQGRQWLEAGSRLHGASIALESALATAYAAALRRALESIAWPAALPEPPQLARARHELMRLDEQPVASAPDPASSAGTREAESDPRSAPAADELEHALAGIETDLDRGRFRPARRRLARARKVMDDNRSVPKVLARRLATASARVAEWQDWRQFAVEPKQHALCEAMEALVNDANSAPAERVARIRSLQAEWKATGGSDSASSRALWQRFSAAADQALEPCREWLEREAAERRANAERRQRIRDQLAGFLAGNDAEAVATVELVRIRRTARAEWLSHQPVNDAEIAAVAKAFETLMDRLTAIIDARREAARSRREAPVAALEALLESDDAEAATADAKRLQGEWQRGEQAHPKVERALWKRLRAASDALFARRADRRDVARGRARALTAEAEACCEALEQLAAEPGERPAEAFAEELRQARERFAGIALPEGRPARGVRHRFERAVRAVEQRAGEGRQRQWRDRLVSMQALEADCVARERGDAGMSEPDWPPYLPGTVAEVLRTRWKAAVAERPITSAEPERPRDIVLRLETPGAIDSPPEDRERRLACQVERLADGIGAGSGEAPQAEAWRLAAEALSAPFPDAALARRFWRGLAAVIADPR